MKRKSDSKIFTVSQLTGNIKELLEDNFFYVCLRGEISNLAAPSSGHLYFNVKDEFSQISGVMFRSAARRVKFDLEDGLEVILRGRITVYEPRGTYQIIAEEAEPLGHGALRLAFEQLKARLDKEGLFNSEFKKPLPFLPKGIGIVTSPSGAALRDILNILERRFPGVPILISPASVQGDAAAGEISRAIRLLQDKEEIDVIIAGRGGGSLEDLWAFNEEIVARAIFESKIPVVSAVGHETDFSIADMVADLRAPTPSAAAELVVPLKEDCLNKVKENHKKLSRALNRKLELYKERLNHINKRLRSPEWIVHNYMLKTDELTNKLTQSAERELLLNKNSWERLNQRLIFASPSNRLRSAGQDMRSLIQRLNKAAETLAKRKNEELAGLTRSLNALSPLSVMERGYAVVSDKKRKIIKSVKQVEKDDYVLVRLNDGTMETKVRKITAK